MKSLPFVKKSLPCVKTTVSLEVLLLVVLHHALIDVTNKWMLQEQASAPISFEVCPCSIQHLCLCIICRTKSGGGGGGDAEEEEEDE